MIALSASKESGKRQPVAPAETVGHNARTVSSSPAPTSKPPIPAIARKPPGTRFIGMANKNNHVIITYFPSADKADTAANLLKESMAKD